MAESSSWVRISSRLRAPARSCLLANTSRVAPARRCVQGGEGFVMLTTLWKDVGVGQHRGREREMPVQGNGMMNICTYSDMGSVSKTFKAGTGKENEKGIPS